MTDPTRMQNEIRRYAALIEPMLPRATGFTAEAEDARSIQVERAIVFPSLLNGGWSAERVTPINRLVELSRLSNLQDIAIVDRSGHHRPVYRGLLIYAWLQAYR